MPTANSTEDEATSMQYSEQMAPEDVAKWLIDVERVIKLPTAELFVVPVPLHEYPDYFTVVEFPMDLSLISARLQHNFYRRQEVC